MQRARENLILLCVVASVTIVSGCSQPLRVPAIDPSGQRIFLPQPATTTLAGDCCPQPVFTTPPAVPPCPPGFPPAANPCTPPPAPVAAPIVAPVAAAPTQLTVLPARMIAPVGTEVVLMSGMAGMQGKFQSGKVIQWSLSRESVGNFLNSNKDSTWLCNAVLKKERTQISSDFATTRSLSAPAVITRGTPATNDDVQVPAGYSWLSLTSSSEGTSHVSVSVPSSGNWNLRRQTATIHWVDAQWTLPSPVAAASGTGQTLMTTLRRSTNAQPIGGWSVRYEVAAGGLAWLGSQGQTVAEVPTSPDGTASVMVLPQQAGSGNARISVQIVRPASVDGSIPRLVVGQAWTNVSWSAPGLSVTMTGPRTATSNATVTYHVQVSNTGDRVARNVTVTDALPGALEFISSEPAASIFGDRLQWNLGEIPPNQTRQMAIVCRTRMDASLRHCVHVRCEAGFNAESCVTTDIITPSLSVNMRGPETAVVGQVVDYFFEVSNTGPAPLTNVVIYDEFDEGLAHVEGLRSPIHKKLGDLQPQESRHIKATFQITRPGALQHRLRVTANGGQRVDTQHTTNASEAHDPRQPAVQPPAQPPVQPPAQPPIQAQAPQQPAEGKADVQIRKVGPKERLVGQMAEFVIEVRNTGKTRLTNLRIADSYESSLEPKAATDGYQVVNGELVWIVESLMPGEGVKRQVNCRCLKADRGAQNRATVTTDQEVASTDETSTLIKEGSVPNVGQPNTGGTPALNISLVDTVDPVTRGGETTYLLTLENVQKVDHRKVVITLHIPDGMSFQKLSASSPVGIEQLGGGRTIRLEPINVLRASEKLPAIRIVVRGDRAGTYQMRVEVDSLRLDKPLEKTIQTKVNEN